MEIEIAVVVTFINSILLIILLTRISQKKVRKHYQDMLVKEIQSIVSELNAVTERNVTIIEDKKQQVTELIRRAESLMSHPLLKPELNPMKTVAKKSTPSILEDPFLKPFPDHLTSAQAKSGTGATLTRETEHSTPHETGQVAPVTAGYSGEREYSGDFGLVEPGIAHPLDLENDPLSVEAIHQHFNRVPIADPKPSSLPLPNYPIKGVDSLVHKAYLSSKAPMGETSTVRSAHEDDPEPIGIVKNATEKNTKQTIEIDDQFARAKTLAMKLLNEGKSDEAIIATTQLSKSEVNLLRSIYSH